jgi:NAD(P)-dependent dehydrogenase (short-subunit alcohol dehydrogenase family)
MTKRYLVSGATSGIGKAFADQLRAKDQHLIAMLRDVTQIAAVPAQQHIIFDYAQPENLSGAIADLPEIDVFVSAAGILLGQSFAEVSLAQAQENLTVNLLTPMLLAKHIAPKLRSGGVMIFMGSISGHKGSYDDGYAAAKGGIHSFVKSLALKLAVENKRVIAIAPGITQGTRMTDTRPADELTAVLQKIPLGRFATPDDIANWISFCASDAARAMTGCVIDINGGQYVR